MKTLNCILLVDDNQPTNFLNKRLLEKINISSQIRFARNGEEALDYLRNCEKVNGEEYPYPDLIFLDINMPRMNGWEFLEEFRERAFNERQTIVIFLLTTSPNPDDELKAKEMPEVAGFLKKPLTQEMLEQKVWGWFE